jgi:hypothetical protein
VKGNSFTIRAVGRVRKMLEAKHRANGLEGVGRKRDRSKLWWLKSAHHAMYNMNPCAGFLRVQT